MGFFKSLFGNKVQPSNSTANNQSGNASQSSNTTTSIEFIKPEDKPYEWFSTAEGIAVLKLYTSPKAYLLEERLKKEIKERDFDGRDVSFDVFVAVYHKDAKIPSAYFSAFVKELKAQPLEYVGPTNLVTSLLCDQGKTFELDDDGEPVEKKSALSPEELVTVEKNPLLKFVETFDCFKLEDDDEGSWDDKYKLYSEVLIFLGFASFGDKEVLNENQWLFDKAIYFNSLGVVKKEKGFIKTCIEKCTYPDFFKKRLDEIEANADND